MKKSLKIIISWITLIFILLIAYILLKNRLSDIKNIFDISVYSILLISIMTFFSISIGGNIFKALVKHYNISLSINEWLGLTYIVKLTNYLFPIGSTSKAVYLKKKYNLSFNSFFVITGATVIIDFFVYSLFGLISVLLLYIYNGFFNLLITMIFLILFIITLCIIIIPLRFNESNNKFINYFIKIINGWNQLKVNKKLLLKLFLFYIILAILSTIRYKLIFTTYDIEISIIACTLIYALTRPTLILRLTPGNLGISEGIIIFAGYLLGISFDKIIKVALLDRVISFVIILIFGSIYLYILIGKNKNGQTN